MLGTDLEDDHWRLRLSHHASERRDEGREWFVCVGEHRHRPALLRGRRRRVLQRRARGRHRARARCLPSEARAPARALVSPVHFTPSTDGRRASMLLGPRGGRASEPARTFLHTGTDMDSVFIYWDNSNIFHEAQRIAEEEEEGPDARFRVRVHFENILRLAHADRPVEKALAAGSVPPEMRQLWNRMEAQGLSVHLYDRGAPGRGEQEIPDRYLQLRMLEDALDYNGDPGIVVLLTGDGAGYLEGAGFHSTLERMHRRNWRVEILSWAHSTNPRMRRWAEANGIFVSLDDFYDAITFLVPSNPGFALARPRKAAELDLSKRRLS